MHRNFNQIFQSRCFQLIFSGPPVHWVFNLTDTFMANHPTTFPLVTSSSRSAQSHIFLRTTAQQTASNNLTCQSLTFQHSCLHPSSCIFLQNPLIMMIEFPLHLRRQISRGYSLPTGKHFSIFTAHPPKTTFHMPSLLKLPTSLFPSFSADGYIVLWGKKEIIS